MLQCVLYKPAAPRLFSCRLTRLDTKQAHLTISDLTPFPSIIQHAVSAPGAVREPLSVSWPLACVHTHGSWTGNVKFCAV